ncbi:protein kinase C delta type-like [Aquarana catesbeiana]|uniref:protein kinase C delta type-like n=1 Tax=Aquarana catesbeiana TaxID=8400 RepID=UPI003CCA1BDF
MESFTFHKVLGRGSFGKVMLATHLATNQKLAVKFVDKRQLLKSGPSIALAERCILEEGRECPYITHIYGSFQTKNHLAFVMEYLSGGDLNALIRSSAPLPLKTVRNLTAEIICGLQFLHAKEIVHRDLKPGNILLDNAGHARIADFGLSAKGVTESKRIKGRMGTPNYMAPEILQKIDYFTMVDYFSLGIIIYMMALGKHPFIAVKDNEEQIRKKIIEMNPQYPRGMNHNLRNLLTRLLWKDQDGRKQQVCDIRSHPFFKTINWAEVEGRMSRTPSESGPICLQPSNNSMHLNECINCMDQEAPKSPEHQEYFTGFSYMRDSLMI